MEKQTEFMKQESPVEYDKEDIKIKRCDQCDFQTVHNKYLEDHQLIHLDKNKNSYLKLEVGEYDVSAKKKRKINPLKKCPKDTNIEQFSCDQCDFKTVQKYYGIENHKLIHLDAASKLEMEIMCDQCDFTTLRKASLIMHCKRKHSGERKPHCNICKAEFTSEDEKKKHKEEVHNLLKGTTKKLYTSEFKVEAVKRINEIGFINTTKELHIPPTVLRKWTNLIFKPVICSFCGKSFAYKKMLKTHEKVHELKDLEPSLSYNKTKPSKLELEEVLEKTNVETDIAAKENKLKKTNLSGNNHYKNKNYGKKVRKEYPCAKCTKSLSSPFRLKYHMQNCTGSTKTLNGSKDDPNFIQTVIQLAKETTVRNSCEVYNLGNTTVRCWINKRDPVKNHLCEICDKSFGYGSQLKAHKISHSDNFPGNQNKKNRANSTYSLSFKEEAVKLARKDSLEESCRRNGISEKLLSGWIRKIEHPILCEICSKGFINMSSYEEHMQSHFPDEEGTAKKTEYSLSFKAEAVKLAKENSVEESCRRYDISECLLSDWIKLLILCEFCSKGYTNTAKYRKHLQLHFPEKVNIQEEKTITSFNRYSISFKEEAVKLAREESIEESCRRNDIKKGLLSEWIKLKENPILCEVCSKGFCNNSKYQSHMQLHHPEKEYIYNPEKEYISIRRNKSGQQIGVDLRQLYLQKYSVDEEVSEKAVIKDNTVKDEITSSDHDDTEEYKFPLADLVEHLDEVPYENTKVLYKNTKVIDDNTKVLAKNTKVLTENTEVLEENTKVLETEIVVVDDNKVQDVITVSGDIPNKQKLVDTDQTDANEMAFVEELLSQNLQKAHERQESVNLKVFPILNETDDIVIDNSKVDEIEKADEIELTEMSLQKYEIDDLIIKTEEGFDLKDETNGFMHANKCEFCGKIFSRTYHKREHVRRVHEKERCFECEICNKKFSAKPSLIIHVRLLHTGDRPFVCQVCGKGFAGNNSFRKHTKNTHTNRENPEEKPTCDQCGVQLASSDSLRQHKFNVHGFGESFKCQICPRKFKSEDSLLNHEKNHEKGDLTCSLCRKELPTKANLRRHVKSHLKIKDFQCIECGNQFPCYRNLKQHVDRIHLKIVGTFSCNVCEKNFHTQSSLSRHKSSHIKSETITKFQCGDCGKSYSTENGFKDHVKIVHQGKKDFYCQACEKSFTRLNSLKVHKLTHTNEKPFQCEFCDQGYKEKRNLLKHIARLHSNQ